jgi:hypothetical protein
MNTSGSQESAQPRGAFLRRTSNTAFARALALNQFRGEENAPGSGSSSGVAQRWILEITGWGTPMITAGNGHPFSKVPDFNPISSEKSPVWAVREGDEVVIGDRRFRSRIRYRPVNSYVESQLPNASKDWGYFGTSFDFQFEVELSVVEIFYRLTIGGEVKTEVERFARSRTAGGFISIDTNTGKTSEKPESAKTVIDGAPFVPGCGWVAMYSITETWDGFTAFIQIPGGMASFVAAADQFNAIPKSYTPAP